jgi:predicted RNA-binding Zn-ribbon protein involved in translation (DUF1610 family)
MSQETVSCPRCKEEFKAEKAAVYECPKCGTSVVPKSDDSDHEKTQIFKV